jgi:hypothetical protein
LPTGPNQSLRHASALLRQPLSGRLRGGHDVHHAGQTDVLEGRTAFRAALDGLGEILPPGFEITGLRQIEGKSEVVSIVEWKAEKVAGSQLSVLFKFRGDKIYEERWFLDTVQWKDAF